MEKKTEEHWREQSEQILTDITEWRRSHPKATFREIEEEVHERMSRLEAQLIQDTAQQSKSRAWSGASSQERPACPVCSTPLQTRGKRQRKRHRGRRTRNHAKPGVWDLPKLWDRSFSPSMRS